jgi:hypothetical protein
VSVLSAEMMLETGSDISLRFLSTCARFGLMDVVVQCECAESAVMSSKHP